MVFQVSTAVPIIPYTPVVTVGVINLIAAAPGNVPAGSTITISFKSNVVEWLAPVAGAGNTAGLAVGGPVGPPFPNLSVSVSSNSVVLSFTATTPFATGDQLWIFGVQINPGTFTGSSETGFKAIFSANSSIPATEPITFTPAIMPVARFA